MNVLGTMSFSPHSLSYLCETESHAPTVHCTVGLKIHSSIPTMQQGLKMHDILNGQKARGPCTLPMVYSYNPKSFSM